MPIGQANSVREREKVRGKDGENVEKENLPFTYLYRFRCGVFPIVVDMMKVRHTGLIMSTDKAHSLPSLPVCRFPFLTLTRVAVGLLLAAGVAAP